MLLNRHFCLLYLLAIARGSTISKGLRKEKLSHGIYYDFPGYTEDKCYSTLDSKWNTEYKQNLMKSLPRIHYIDYIPKKNYKIIDENPSTNSGGDYGQENIDINDLIGKLNDDKGNNNLNTLAAKKQTSKKLKFIKKQQKNEAKTNKQKAKKRRSKFFHFDKKNKYTETKFATTASFVDIDNFIKSKFIPNTHKTSEKYKSLNERLVIPKLSERSRGKYVASSELDKYEDHVNRAHGFISKESAKYSMNVNDDYFDYELIDPSNHNRNRWKRSHIEHHTKKSQFPKQKRSANDSTCFTSIFNISSEHSDKKSTEHFSTANASNVSVTDNSLSDDTLTPSNVRNTEPKTENKDSQNNLLFDKTNQISMNVFTLSANTNSEVVSFPTTTLHKGIQDIAQLPSVIVLKTSPKESLLDSIKLYNGNAKHNSNTNLVRIDLTTPKVFMKTDTNKIKENVIMFPEIEKNYTCNDSIVKLNDKKECTYKEKNATERKVTGKENIEKCQEANMTKRSDAGIIHFVKARSVKESTEKTVNKIKGGFSKMYHKIKKPKVKKITTHPTKTPKSPGKRPKVKHSNKYDTNYGDDEDNNFIALDLFCDKSLYESDASPYKNSDPITISKIPQPDLNPQKKRCDLFTKEIRNKKDNKKELKSNTDNYLYNLSPATKKRRNLFKIVHRPKVKDSKTLSTEYKNFEAELSDILRSGPDIKNIHITNAGTTTTHKVPKKKPMKNKVVTEQQNQTKKKPITSKKFHELFGIEEIESVGIENHFPKLPEIIFTNFNENNSQKYDMYMTEGSKILYEPLIDKDKNKPSDLESQLLFVRLPTKVIAYNTSENESYNNLHQPDNEITGIINQSGNNLKEIFNYENSELVKPFEFEESIQISTYSPIKDNVFVYNIPELKNVAILNQDSRDEEIERTTLHNNKMKQLMEKLHIRRYSSINVKSTTPLPKESVHEEITIRKSDNKSFKRKPVSFLSMFKSKPQIASKVTDIVFMTYNLNQLESELETVTTSQSIMTKTIPTSILKNTLDKPTTQEPFNSVENPNFLKNIFLVGNFKELFEMPSAVTTNINDSVTGKITASGINNSNNFNTLNHTESAPAYSNKLQEFLENSPKTDNSVEATKFELKNVSKNDKLQEFLKNSPKTDRSADQLELENISTPFGNLLQLEVMEDELAKMKEHIYDSEKKGKPYNFNEESQQNKWIKELALKKPKFTNEVDATKTQITQAKRTNIQNYTSKSLFNLDDFLSNPKLDLLEKKLFATKSNKMQQKQNEQNLEFNNRYDSYKKYNIDMNTETNPGHKSLRTDLTMRNYSKMPHNFEIENLKISKDRQRQGTQKFSNIQKSPTLTYQVVPVNLPYKKSTIRGKRYFFKVKNPVTFTYVDVGRDKRNNKPGNKIDDEEEISSYKKTIHENTDKEEFEDRKNIGKNKRFIKLFRTKPTNSKTTGNASVSQEKKQTSSSIKRFWYKRKKEKSIPLQEESSASEKLFSKTYSTTIMKTNSYQVLNEQSSTEVSPINEKFLLSEEMTPKPVDINIYENILVKVTKANLKSAASTDGNTLAALNFEKFLQDNNVNLEDVVKSVPPEVLQSEINYFLENLPGSKQKSTTTLENLITKILTDLQNSSHYKHFDSAAVFTKKLGNISKLKLFPQFKTNPSNGVNENSSTIKQIEDYSASIQTELNPLSKKENIKLTTSTETLATDEKSLYKKLAIIENLLNMDLTSIEPEIDSWTSHISIDNITEHVDKYNEIFIKNQSSTKMSSHGVVDTGRLYYGSKETNTESLDPPCNSLPNVTYVGFIENNENIGKKEGVHERDSKFNNLFVKKHVCTKMASHEVLETGGMYYDLKETNTENSDPQSNPLSTIIYEEFDENNKNKGKKEGVKKFNSLQERDSEYTDFFVKNHSSTKMASHEVVDTDGLYYGVKETNTENPDPPCSSLSTIIYEEFIDNNKNKETNKENKFKGVKENKQFVYDNIMENNMEMSDSLQFDHDKRSAFTFTQTKITNDDYDYENDVNQNETINEYLKSSIEGKELSNLKECLYKHQNVDYMFSDHFPGRSKPTHNRLFWGNTTNTKTTAMNRESATKEPAKKIQEPPIILRKSYQYQYQIIFPTKRLMPTSPEYFESGMSSTLSTEDFPMMQLSAQDDSYSTTTESQVTSNLDGVGMETELQNNVDIGNEYSKFTKYNENIMERNHHKRSVNNEKQNKQAKTASILYDLRTTGPSHLHNIVHRISDTFRRSNRSKSTLRTGENVKFESTTPLSTHTEKRSKVAPNALFPATTSNASLSTDEVLKINKVTGVPYTRHRSKKSQVSDQDEQCIDKRLSRNGLKNIHSKLKLFSHPSSSKTSATPQTTTFTLLAAQATQDTSTRPMPTAAHRYNEDYEIADLHEVITGTTWYDTLHPQNSQNDITAMKYENTEIIVSSTEDEFENIANDPITTAVHLVCDPTNSIDNLVYDTISPNANEVNNGTNVIESTVCGTTDPFYNFLYNTTIMKSTNENTQTATDDDSTVVFEDLYDFKMLDNVGVNNFESGEENGEFNPRYDGSNFGGMNADVRKWDENDFNSADGKIHELQESHGCELEKRIMHNPRKSVRVITEVNKKDLAMQKDTTHKLRDKSKRFLQTKRRKRLQSCNREFTARNVASLEVVVDIVKNPNSRHQSTVPIDCTTHTSLNAIQIHISPPNYDNGKRSMNSVSRKVFSAKLSSPVDIIYSIESLIPTQAALIEIKQKGYRVMDEKGFHHYEQMSNKQTTSHSNFLLRLINDWNKYKHYTPPKQVRQTTRCESQDYIEDRKPIPTLEGIRRHTNDILKSNKTVKRSIRKIFRKIFGNDHVCSCRCHANRVMCKSCAASTEVINELMFEFQNIAKYMSEHCTEIQTFFWMNPTEGKKLRGLVNDINKSMNEYFTRVKGKCKGQNCNNLCMERRRYYRKKRSHQETKKGASLEEQIIGVKRLVRKVQHFQCGAWYADCIEKNKQFNDLFNKCVIVRNYQHDDKINSNSTSLIRTKNLNYPNIFDINKNVGNRVINSKSEGGQTENLSTKQVDSCVYNIKGMDVKIISVDPKCGHAENKRSENEYMPTVFTSHEDISKNYSVRNCNNLKKSVKNIKRYLLKYHNCEYHTPKTVTVKAKVPDVRTSKTEMSKQTERMKLKEENECEEMVKSKKTTKETDTTPDTKSKTGGHYNCTKVITCHILTEDHYNPEKKMCDLVKLIDYETATQTIGLPTKNNVSKRQTNGEYENVMESPLITDSGGRFWFDYLKKGTKNRYVRHAKHNKPHSTFLDFLRKHDTHTNMHTKTLSPEILKRDLFQIIHKRVHGKHCKMNKTETQKQTKVIKKIEKIGPGKKPSWVKKIVQSAILNTTKNHMIDKIENGYTNLTNQTESCQPDSINKPFVQNTQNENKTNTENNNPNLKPSNSFVNETVTEIKDIDSETNVLLNNDIATTIKSLESELRKVKSNQTRNKKPNTITKEITTKMATDSNHLIAESKKLWANEDNIDSSHDNLTTTIRILEDLLNQKANAKSDKPYASKSYDYNSSDAKAALTKKKNELITELANKISKILEQRGNVSTIKDTNNKQFNNETQMLENLQQINYKNKFPKTPVDQKNFLNSTKFSNIFNIENGTMESSKNNNAMIETKNVSKVLKVDYHIEKNPKCTKILSNDIKHAEFNSPSKIESLPIQRNYFNNNTKHSKNEHTQNQIQKLPSPSKNIGIAKKGSTLNSQTNIPESAKHHVGDIAAKHVIDNKNCPTTSTSEYEKVNMRNDNMITTKYYTQNEFHNFVDIAAPVTAIILDDEDGKSKPVTKNKSSEQFCKNFDILNSKNNSLPLTENFNVLSHSKEILSNIGNIVYITERNKFTKTRPEVTQKPQSHRNVIIVKSKPQDHEKVGNMKQNEFISALRYPVLQSLVDDNQFAPKTNAINAEHNSELTTAYCKSCGRSTIKKIRDYTFKPTCNSIDDSSKNKDRMKKDAIHNNTISVWIDDVHMNCVLCNFHGKQFTNSKAKDTSHEIDDKSKINKPQTTQGPHKNLNHSSKETEQDADYDVEYTDNEQDSGDGTSEHASTEITLETENSPNNNSTEREPETKTTTTETIERTNQIKNTMGRIIETDESTKIEIKKITQPVSERKDTIDKSKEKAHVTEIKNKKNTEEIMESETTKSRATEMAKDTEITKSKTTEKSLKTDNQTHPSTDYYDEIIDATDYESDLIAYGAYPKIQIVTTTKNFRAENPIATKLCKRTNKKKWAQILEIIEKKLWHIPETNTSSVRPRIRKFITKRHPHHTTKFQGVPTRRCPKKYYKFTKPHSTLKVECKNVNNNTGLIVNEAQQNTTTKTYTTTKKDKELGIDSYITTISGRYPSMKYNIICSTLNGKKIPHFIGVICQNYHPKFDKICDPADPKNTCICKLEDIVDKLMEAHSHLKPDEFEQYVGNMTCQKYVHMPKPFVLLREKHRKHRSENSKVDRKKQWDTTKGKIKEGIQYFNKLLSKPIHRIHNKRLDDIYEREYDKYKWNWIRNKRSNVVEEMKDEHRSRRTTKIDLTVVDKGLRNLPPFELQKDETYILRGDITSLSCPPSGVSGRTESWSAERNMLQRANVVAEGATVTVRDVQLENMGVYNCSQNGLVVRSHHLTVTAVPRYDLVFLLLYDAAEGCDIEDLLSFHSELPHAVEAAVCGHGRACHASIEEPVCLSLKEERRIRATGVLTLATQEARCNARCASVLQASMAALCSTGVPPVLDNAVVLSSEGVNRTLHPTDLAEDADKWRIAHSLPKKERAGLHYHRLAAHMSTGELNLVLTCEAGFYLLPRQKICVACPMGHYSRAGSTFCQRCAAGRITEHPGAAHCRRKHGSPRRHHEAPGVQINRYQRWTETDSVLAGGALVVGAVTAYALAMLAVKLCRRREKVSSTTSTLREPRSRPWLRMARRKRAMSPSRVILGQSELRDASCQYTPVIEEEDILEYPERSEDERPPLPPIDFEF